MSMTEDKIYALTIPGQPRGKQRTGGGDGGRRYTPEQTRNYEDKVRWLWRQKHPGMQPLTVPLYVVIRAYFEPPKSASKSRREDMLTGKIRPTVTPDWDNIGKIICDALNGLAYEDDRQIVGATVIKAYADEPSVWVSICRWPTHDA
jgi:Holliday junction resolvase RusA-like endonuclease